MEVATAASSEPNSSFLDPVTVANGTEHHGNDAALGRLLARLRKGESIRVSALGGSISAGSTVTVKHGRMASWLYHAKLVAALRSLYPSSPPHVHHNGALLAVS